MVKESDKDKAKHDNIVWWLFFYISMFVMMFTTK